MTEKKAAKLAKAHYPDEAGKEQVSKLIEDHGVEFVDLRFTDLRGKEHHVTLPQNKIDDNFFLYGKAFDGSSLCGWQDINESDLLLIPDASTAIIDIFCEAPTLNLRCDVYNPITQAPYARDPRGVAIRAEKYLAKSGIADVCHFGQEVEFFIFEDVRWDIQMNGCFYEVDSDEANWNTGTVMESGNMGHRPRIKGGYFPVPPVDSFHDLRGTMCTALMNMGLIPEVHHHEVATCGQNEITTRYSTLLHKCDEQLIFKYVIQNVANAHNKTVTFMPKPLVGDNGSGLHCHQSLSKEGKNIFAGDEYAGLSETALYYIGGIIKHARALNAFTNPTTNSYKRLVPGFEAPVTMVYSEGNRSAGIRIPRVFSEKEKRIEVRFPDAMANPYLAFPAMLMAGLDGIKNKIHPGQAIDENLYDLPEKKVKSFPSLASSLEQALDCLEKDQAFLLEGGVFTKELIDAYITVKREEVTRVNMTTHPVEFDLYYSL
ncbi:MAG: type I glutamate--ammonia ligase [Gammaproteobacteria bacterium]|nr:type I glutamate--ammonia ligase [Gammaproteobacteria bacterium]MCW5584457.1 type I glutamate--ammonia ligase [Gammaproteobacteria bacterium]